MEEAPENGKESSHSAHANGMNESASHSPLILRQKNQEQWQLHTISM